MGAAEIGKPETRSASAHQGERFVNQPPVFESNQLSSHSYQGHLDLLLRLL
jgi:hypothetical protein